MPHKLLIVEDNDQFRGMIRSLLAMRGYEVIVASNGPEGLAIAQAEPIDAVLSDVDMPGMDGFEFCRQVLAQCKERNQDVPVWIMSGLFSPVLTKRAAAAGAVLVLRKPFPIEEFCRQLETEFQKRAEAACGEPPATTTDSGLAN